MRNWRRRGQRLASLHAGAQRRIIKMTERLDVMPPKTWFGIYGAALWRESQRVRYSKQQLRKVNERREEWRREQVHVQVSR